MRRRTRTIQGLNRGRHLETENKAESQSPDGLAGQRYSAARYRDLFDRAPVGYHEIDSHGRIAAVNRTELEMLGYARDEMLGQHFWDFAEDDEAARHEFLKEIDERWQPTSTTERAYRKKDGSTLRVLVASLPLLDENGRVAGFRSTMQGITDFKQSQERRLDATRLASIGELSAGMAHNLNNPLASMMGHIQLLLGQELPQGTLDDVETVRAEAQRVSEILQNLSTFARIRDAQRVYAHLNRVVERALEIKSSDLRNANIAVTAELADIPRTMMDEQQLLQAVLNVLTNAEQALGEVGDARRITVRSDTSDDTITLSVADNGPGILAEHLDKVFDPFFTTREVGKGIGLGLSACYGAVMQHGGDLSVESAPGEGATFHIKLPVLRPHRQEEAAEPQVQDSAAPKRILVADDEPGIRSALSRLLTLEGYQVDLAKDGKEAWDKVRASSYDHILLDLKMPIMDGQQLFQLIKDSDGRQASRIIFVTGDTVSQSTSDFTAASGNPLLDKPFRLQDIRDVIVRSRAVAVD